MKIGDKVRHISAPELGIGRVLSVTEPNSLQESWAYVKWQKPRADGSGMKQTHWVRVELLSLIPVSEKRELVLDTIGFTLLLAGFYGAWIALPGVG